MQTVQSPKKKQVRGGRYRRVLATEAELALEAPFVEERLAPLLSLWRGRLISDPEMAAFYIYIYTSQRRPDTWLGGPHSASLGDRRPSPAHGEESFDSQDSSRQEPAIIEIFSEFSVRSIPLAVNSALVEWARGRYALTLTTEVPTPEEILRMQCESKRCVSMVVEPEQLRQHILNQRDPLGFLLHDLVHADKFYRNKTMMAGQVGFSRFIYRLWTRGIFNELMASDSVFKKELEYVVGDMNSFCVHLLKCLKAVCLGTFLRREGKAPNERLSDTGARLFDEFYRGLFDEAPQIVIGAAEKLNSPEERHHDVNRVLCSYFETLGAAPLESVGNCV